MDDGVKDAGGEILKKNIASLITKSQLTNLFSLSHADTADLRRNHAEYIIYIIGDLRRARTLRLRLPSGG